MKLDSLIAEIEVDLAQYKAAGLIDKTSLVRWANNALKKFGQSICTRTEKVLQVEGGQCSLPEGFHSLQLAVKCNPASYYYEEEDVNVLQNSIVWKERFERSTKWNSCTPCCKTEGESIITENVYINEKLITFYYESPSILKLGKTFKKDVCAKDCRNLFITENPYEINIIGNTLQTNFTDGTVYIQYYGLEVDEMGLPIIPDTPRGELATYIEMYLKKKLFEKFIMNGDENNVATLLQYYSQQENQQYPKALADSKFLTFNWNSYGKVMANNRINMLRNEYLLPKF